VPPRHVALRLMTKTTSRQSVYQRGQVLRERCSGAVLPCLSCFTEERKGPEAGEGRVVQGRWRLCKPKLQPSFTGRERVVASRGSWRLQGGAA